jgi:hypothetical protein
MDFGYGTEEGGAMKRWLWVGLIVVVATVAMYLAAVAIEAQAPFKFGEWSLRIRQLPLKAIGVEYQRSNGKTTRAIGVTYTKDDGSKDQVFFRQTMPNPVYVYLVSDSRGLAVDIEEAPVYKSYPFGIEKRVGTAKRYTILMNPVFDVIIEPIER